LRHRSGTNPKLRYWGPIGLALVAIHWVIHAASLFPFLHAVSIVAAMAVAWYFGVVPAAVLGVIDGAALYFFLLEETFAGQQVAAGAALVTYAFALAAIIFTVSRWRHHLARVEVGEKRLDSLYHLVRAFNETHNLDDFFRQATEVLRETLDFKHIALLLYDEDTEELVIKSAVGYEPEGGMQGMRIPLDRGITGVATRSRSTVVLGDVTQDERYVVGSPSIRSEVATPLLHDDKLLGVLNIESEQERAFTQNDVRLLELLAGELTLVLERVQLMERLRIQSITDPLTGLFNHRHLKRCLVQEVHRAKRYDKPVSLLLMDVDDFKLVNDRHGHTFGDRVLRAIGQRTQAQLRLTDILARYGGEEFAVILPETPLESAVVAGERVRRAIASSPVEHGDKEVEVTISVGAAAYPSGAADWDTLLAAADRALYRAKENGKNLVSV